MSGTQLLMPRNSQTAPSLGPTAAGRRLGAGAGQGSLVLLPLKRKNFSTGFEPVRQQTLPLEWREFRRIVEDINGAIHKAPPRRVLHCCFPGMAFIGFLLFAGGGALGIMGSDPGGPSSAGLLMVFVGFVMTVSDVIGSVLVGGGSPLASPDEEEEMLGNIHGHLVSLNNRFVQRGVDFQLHESGPLEKYCLANRIPIGDLAAAKYTLVVQTVHTDPVIPSPNVVSTIDRIHSSSIHSHAMDSPLHSPRQSHNNSEISIMMAELTPTP